MSEERKRKEMATTSYDDVEENKYKQLILRPWPTTEILGSNMTSQKFQLAKDLLNSILKVDARSKTFYHCVIKSIPEYKDVIPNPLCLEEVQKKLHNGMYSTVEIFLRDLRRVFANCIRYWGPTGMQPIISEALHRLKLCEDNLTPKLSNWRLCKSWMKCMRVLSGLLAKGEKVTYIFQRPVSFYYNGAIPKDYIPTVLYMSDIGSLTSSLLEGDVASPQGFVRECVRIFRNCQMYTEHEDYRRCVATMLKELESLVAVELPKCLSEVKDDRWKKQKKKQKLKAEDSATTNVKDSSSGVKQQKNRDSPVKDINNERMVASLLHPDELRSRDVPLNMTTSQRRSASHSNSQLEAMKKELGTSVTKTFVSQVRKACGGIFDKLRNETIAVNGQMYSTDLFFAPVDESLIPDYRQHISSPMDLGQAEALLNKGSLDSVARLFKTIRKVFENAIEYNAPKIGKHGSTTIYDLGTKLLREVHKLEENKLEWIHNIYKIIFLERQNAGGGEEGRAAHTSTDHVLCIPEKCPNVSVELLDSLKLKERLERLLEVKHDRKRSSSYGGGGGATTSPPKPTTKPCISSSPTPEDEVRNNERHPKINSSMDTAESRRSNKNSNLTKQPTIRRITLKLSTPAPPLDKLSNSKAAETPVQKHLPTEVSRTGIHNASGVHLGTGSAEPNMLIIPTGPSHLPNSRPWVATHLFEPPKGLSQQHEKWELGCDKVLKRLMRHEFVDPKKSTLYLHVPACSILPSADAYLDVIENPMDLGSIQKALEQREIRDAQSFVDLTLLVFNNAIKFNIGSDNPNAMHLVDSCSFLGHTFSWMCLESLELRDDESSDRCTEGKKLLSEAASHIPSCPLTTGFCQQQRLSRLQELEELHVPRDGDKEAFQLIKKLCTYQNLKYMKWFSDPVDVALIPDYREHVPNPIDISTIENKLTTHEYLKYGEFVSDLRRIFTNAIRYNERLRAVDKNSNLICQAVEQMQPVLERLLFGRFSIDVLERVGREQVLNNKRKHYEEGNRRMFEARRKVNEDPQKFLKTHLPQEEESIGEVSGLNAPTNAAPLMKRRDLGRRKVQRTRELELMEQQRADRLRCVVTKNVRRLCREHPSMCHVEGPPYRSSTAMEDVGFSSSNAELKKKTSNEDMDDNTARATNDTYQQYAALPLCDIVNGEKKWQPMKFREKKKKRNLPLLSSVLYDFQSMNDETEEEVDTKQQQLLLHNTRAPVATVEAAVAAQDTIKEIPSLSNGVIRRQSFHIESLDRNETVFEEIRFFFPQRPKQHSAFASVNLVAEGILLTPCREVQVLLHSGPNHSVRSFGEDDQWKDMETLQRVRLSIHNLRTVGPEEDCALLCHPITTTTSKGDDVRVSAVLQASDMDDETYLPVFGGCLVWTAVPCLGPPNHDEFCLLSRYGAIGNARMCSKFAVAHAATPRTE